jgi:hypothetical protein
MVEQHLSKRGGVREQALNRAGRQGIEGVVGWGKGRPPRLQRGGS